jgi:hypothetical protein
MTVRTNSLKAVSAVAALAVAGGALAVPTFASAQSYGQSYGSAYQGERYYEPCLRDQRTRGTTGGLVGAAIGAGIGSQVASRGARTEGGVLGALLGAAIGSSVGREQAACTPTGYQGYAQRGYYEDNRYDGRAYSGAYREERYDDRYAYSRNVAERSYSGAEDCRLADSVIRLPNGRTETRYVRVCADERGEYRVVD